MISPRRIAPGFLLLVPALVLAACRDVPRPIGEGVSSTPSTRLGEHPPIDVAVAPVANMTGTSDGSLPAGELREAFWWKLVDQRYSPLALDFVDKHVVDAAYKSGAPGEQAVLLVQVEKWDTSLWETHNVISVKLTAHLVDAADGSGAAGRSGAGDLWTGKVDQRFDFGSDAEKFTTEAARMTWACRQIAAAVLARLPARQPKPGASSD